LSSLAITVPASVATRVRRQVSTPARITVSGTDDGSATRCPNKARESDVNVTSTDPIVRHPGPLP